MTATSDRAITVPQILAWKGTDHRITCLTAYDYSWAKVLDAAGIDLLLVGDSLACTVQGHTTTIPATLDEMIYHAKCVVRGTKRALVLGDLPFMSYQVSAEQALHAAGRLVKEGGVAAVKLEGGTVVRDTIARIVDCDIPVVGHIGLTPQSYHRMGGHKVQGKQRSSRAGGRDRIIEDALAVESAGAFAVVIEGVPGELAAEITEMLSIPTIGIGAGNRCDGQILVTHDMLGMNTEFQPKFVKAYANLGEVIRGAVGEYVREVQAGEFPGPEHTFKDTAGPSGSKPERRRPAKMGNTRLKIV